MRTKRFLKISSIVIVSIAALYLLIIFAAGIYIDKQKKNIIAYISHSLSSKLRGKTVIGDIDISVWRNFFSLSIRLDGFALSDSLSSQPLISVKHASASIGFLSMITGKRNINDVLIEDGSFHVFTDSSGYTNGYLLKSRAQNDTNSKSANTDVYSFSHIRLKNINFIIEDIIREKEISFVTDELSASVKQNGSIYTIRMSEIIRMKKGLGFNLAKGAFLEKQALTGKWVLIFNTADKTLEFEKASIIIDRHPYALSGRFSFKGEDPSFRIDFSVKQINYIEAGNLLPERIRKKLGIIELEAPLDASGNIAGSLLPAHEPAISINWQTKNNKLTWDAVRFTHCNFSGNYMNSVDSNAAHNDRNSRISFTDFSADWDGILFTADNTSITNLDTAWLQVHAISETKLDVVDKKLALRDIVFRSGNAHFSLFYNGPIIKDKSFMKDIEGTITVKNGIIRYVPRNFNFSNCNGDIVLLKDSISLKNFSCRYRDNKFNAEVTGTNIRRKLIPGALNKPPVIECYLRSPFINLADFTGLYGKKNQRDAPGKAAVTFEAASRAIDDMLDNSIIGIHINAASLKHGNLAATALQADIRFAAQYWELQKISFAIAGGNIVTSGRIQLAPDNSHTAFLNLKATHTNINKLLSAFDNFGQDVLTDKNLSGIFSSTAILQAGINADGKIIPASLKGSVDFTLTNAELRNFDPLNNLKSFVFKNRDMRNVRFAELKDKFEINGEDLFINRMEVQSTVFRLFLEGHYGLSKKNTNLLIQVPFSNLNKNSFSDEAGPSNKGISAKTGAGILLRAVNKEDGKIKVSLTVSKKTKEKK